MNTLAQIVAPLYLNGDILVPICEFDIRSTTLVALISFKDEHQPVISYASKMQLCDHSYRLLLPAITTHSQFSDVLRIYSSAHINTVKSPIFITKGCQHTLYISETQVVERFTSFFRNTEGSVNVLTNAIGFLKDIRSSSKPLSLLYQRVETMMDELFERTSRQMLSEKKASIIQSAFRICISDPSYLLCRRRLLREFASLLESFAT